MMCIATTARAGSRSLLALGIACLVMAVPVCAAAEPVAGYVFGFGGRSGDSGTGIAADGAGNVYSTGYFGAAVDFDPDLGHHFLGGGQSVSVFVRSLDAAGRLRWVHALPFGNRLAPPQIAVASDGSVFGAGRFKGAVDADPGEESFLLESAGDDDVIIWKWDSNGDFQWARAIGGPQRDDVQAIAVDGAGNVYCTGTFTGTAAFDSGPALVELTSNGATDIFICKHDANGVLQWARQIGDLQNQNPTDIAVTDAGIAYVTGSFHGTIDFDPGEGVAYLTGGGGGDAFLAKLDASGQYLWATSTGTNELEQGSGVSVDNEGGVYLTGTFNEDFDIDPGPGEVVVTTEDGPDVFICKFNGADEFQWGRSFGSERSVKVTGMNSEVGTIFLTGIYEGEMDVDPGPGVVPLADSGAQSVFVSALTSAGALLWAGAMGGDEDIQANALAVDPAGNVYLSGEFEGAADLDPFSGVYEVVASGGTDVFEVRLGQPAAPEAHDDAGETNADVILTTLTDPKASSVLANDTDMNVQPPLAVSGHDTVSALGAAVVVNADGTFSYDPRGVPALQALDLGESVADTFAYTASDGTSESTASVTIDVYGAGTVARGPLDHLRPGYVTAMGPGEFRRIVGEAVAADANGNTYITGRFSGTVDFDSGSGVVELTAEGPSDVFVCKFDPVGALVWARDVVVDEEQYAYGHDLAVDATGNVYVAGEFSGGADFDPGPDIRRAESAGGTDSFVWKLDSAGSLVWVHSFGGPERDVASALGLDPDGNVNLALYFFGLADFDPGDGVFSLESGDLPATAIVKLSSSGGFLWAGVIKGEGRAEAHEMAIDAQGNIFLAGWFSGIVDFDPGAGVDEPLVQGGREAFVCKLGAEGGFLWVWAAEGSGTEGATGIALDDAGGVYATGHFDGAPDFDSGPGEQILESAGMTDVFAVRLDGGGELVWVKSVGGAGSEGFNDMAQVGDSIAVDRERNVYITGSFSDPVYLAPGQEGSLYLSSGDSDIYVTKLDGDGSFAWAGTMGGKGVDICADITADATGNVYTTGYVQTAADLDPGSGVFEVTAAVEGTYLFLGKLEPPRAPVANDDEGRVNSDQVFVSHLDDAIRNVLTNDTDGNTRDTLAVVDFDATSAMGASVTVAPDGTFIYDPTVAPAFQSFTYWDSANDTFSYTISDGTETAVGMVSMWVYGPDFSYDGEPGADLLLYILDLSDGATLTMGETAALSGEARSTSGALVDCDGHCDWSLYSTEDARILLGRQSDNSFYVPVVQPGTYSLALELGSVEHLRSSERVSVTVVAGQMPVILDELLYALDTADADDDGGLNVVEAQTVRPGLTAAQFGAMDSNANGVLSEAELSVVIEGGEGEGEGEGCQFPTTAKDARSRLGDFFLIGLALIGLLGIRAAGKRREV